MEDKVAFLIQDFRVIVSYLPVLKFFLATPENPCCINGFGDIFCTYH
nr:MAG TPA: hypothetical protein [Caudoviricetes sp.]